MKKCKGLVQQSWGVKIMRTILEYLKITRFKSNCIWLIELWYGAIEIESNLEFWKERICTCHEVFCIQCNVKNMKLSDFWEMNYWEGEGLTE